VTTDEQDTNSDDVPDDKVPWLAPYRFKKGESGNPNGRPKGMSIEAQLRKRLNTGESGEKIVESLINVALRQALGGDFRFWNSIIERVDGKVADRIAGPDGGGLTVILENMRSETNDDDTTHPAT
tara:strand:+ start:870 stop:1244 length:375 start_codon:yes stop_codon:yes gene_type:complete